MIVPQPKRNPPRPYLACLGLIGLIVSWNKTIRIRKTHFWRFPRFALLADPLFFVCDFLYPPKKKTSLPSQRVWVWQRFRFTALGVARCALSETSESSESLSGGYEATGRPHHPTTTAASSQPLASERRRRTGLASGRSEAERHMPERCRQWLKARALLRLSGPSAWRPLQSFGVLFESEARIGRWTAGSRNALHRGSKSLHTHDAFPPQGQCSFSFKQFSILSI